MQSSGFSCGPFLSASARIEEIGYNLYFSYLYAETMKEHNKLELKLDEAKLAEDSEYVEKIEAELCYL